MFSLKDKNSYPACQIYEGACVFENTYIGETIQKFDVWWNKHKDIRKESKPTKTFKGEFEPQIQMENRFPCS